ncbi:YrbL family protein [Pseudaestuariivita rosea]|uniref:YrbL family protein n=1 Tax=Pseudaestuariivita rosea TaxID=2763263 RepID=UPI001ABB3772|nr:YrbL family protein [Pseudaestuariivita rosea]
MLIDLDNAPPISQGGKREIYNHPNDPTQIIKVILPRRQQKERDRSFWERIYKPPYTWEYMREISTIYRAARMAPVNLARLPLVQTAGLVRTTKGLGLSVEKITADDGSLAPQLSQLQSKGLFTDHHLERLNDFVRLIFQLRIVAGDLHPNNIVWDHKTDSFVAIDGFGERTVVPVHVWSKTINNHKLNKTFQRKLSMNIGLTWDPRTRQLSM